MGTGSRKKYENLGQVSIGKVNLDGSPEDCSFNATAGTDKNQDLHATHTSTGYQIP